MPTRRKPYIVRLVPGTSMYVLEGPAACLLHYRRWNDRYGAECYAHDMNEAHRAAVAGERARARRVAAGKGKRRG